MEMWRAVRSTIFFPSALEAEKAVDYGVHARIGAGEYEQTFLKPLIHFYRRTSVNPVPRINWKRIKMKTWPMKEIIVFRIDCILIWIL